MARVGPVDRLQIGLGGLSAPLRDQSAHAQRLAENKGWRIDSHGEFCPRARRTSWRTTTATTRNGGRARATSDPGRPHRGLVWSLSPCDQRMWATAPYRDGRARHHPGTRLGVGVRARPVLRAVHRSRRRRAAAARAFRPGRRSCTRRAADLAEGTVEAVPRFVADALEVLPGRLLSPAGGCARRRGLDEVEA